MQKTSLYFLTNNVTIKLYMLGPFVKALIVSYMSGGLIITVESWNSNFLRL